MKHFIFSWVIATVAVFVSAYVIPGVEIDGVLAAFVTAIILGIVNTFIKPVLLVLTLPISIFTLGLFTLVINAFLIMLTGYIVPGFEVAGFGWALLFGLILSLVNFFLNKLK